MIEYKKEAEYYLNHDFDDHLRHIKLATQDGWLDASKAYFVLDRLEKLAKEYKSELLDQAVNEVSEYDKGLEFNGFKIEKINSAGRWDFKNVKEWVKQKDALKEVEEKAKLAYKNWEKGLSGVDTETGEQIEVPAYIPGKETIKISKLK